MSRPEESSPRTDPDLVVCYGCGHWVGREDQYEWEVRQQFREQDARDEAEQEASLADSIAAALANQYAASDSAEGPKKSLELLARANLKPGVAAILAGDDAKRATELWDAAIERLRQRRGNDADEIPF